MRKSQKTIGLACTLFFVNIIALNLPLSINELASPIPTNRTTNVSALEQQILHPTATKVGASHCYPTNIPVPKASYISCSLAIWQIPRDDTPRLFQPEEFPIRHKYEECSVTLSLRRQDVGSWTDVDLVATNLWFSCQEEYPNTLRGATGVAGSYGRIFVRIWFEKKGNVTDDGVTARGISEGGLKGDDEGWGLSDEWWGLLVGWERRLIAFGGVYQRQHKWGTASHAKCHLLLFVEMSFSLKYLIGAWCVQITQEFRRESTKYRLAPNRMELIFKPGILPFTLSLPIFCKSAQQVDKAMRNSPITRFLMYVAFVVH